MLGEWLGRFSRSHTMPYVISCMMPIQLVAERAQLHTLRCENRHTYLRALPEKRAAQRWQRCGIHQGSVDPSSHPLHNCWQDKPASGSSNIGSGWKTHPVPQTTWSATVDYTAQEIWELRRTEKANQCHKGVGRLSASLTLSNIGWRRFRGVITTIYYKNTPI